MKKAKFIDSVKVGSPCSEDWDEMAGNSQIRFCSHCTKDVNNISEMRRKDAMRLIQKYNGRLCIRYDVDSKTNRPIFLDRLHKLTRQVPSVTAGVMATSFAFATAVYPQTNPPTAPQNTSQLILKMDDGTVAVSGYVTDPNGAAVSFAVVTLINEKTFEYRAANSSLEGFYEFKDVPAGEYTIKFEGSGFEAKQVKEVSISGGGGEFRKDAQLSPQGVVETVEVRTKDRFSQVYTSCAGDCVMIEPKSPLVQAAFADDLEEVKARVMMGAKINTRDKAYDGITPLHAAVENGNIEIVQFLLDNGAKTNIRDFQKRTPLMMLDSDASPELLDLLIRYGAKLSLIDKEKNTVLHHLARQSADPEIIRLLISHGLDVNALNTSSETALMMAVEDGNEETAKVLLESGADVGKKNYDSETTWDLAESAEMRTMLESYGAVARNP